MEMTKIEAMDKLHAKIISSNLAEKITEQEMMAFCDAKNALEKQIAKKPIPIDYEKYVDVIENAHFLRGACWCPNCKHVVKSGSYCNDCGQKLNWDEFE